MMPAAHPRTQRWYRATLVLPASVIPPADPQRRRWYVAILVLLVALLPAASAQAQDIRINEILASNSGVFLDEDGDSSDFIELYNASGQPVNLSGFRLSDDPARPDRWILPSITMDPGAFLVIVASGKDRPGLSGTWETMVRRGDIWRYIRGSGAITLDWMQPSFDDGVWGDGASGFGYGDSDDATAVPGAISVLARKTFDVADPAAVTALELHLDFDDGFVAYLNGAEVARENMGAAGSIAYPSQEATGSSEALLYQGLIPPGRRLDPALLVAGQNLLAVQVHNVSSSSSDLTMIPFLTLATQSGGTDLTGVAPEIAAALAREVHASFRIASGEEVCLSDPAGVVLSCLTTTDAPTDVSMGPGPSGGVELFSPPTPGAPNISSGTTGTAGPVTATPGAGRYTENQTVRLETEGAATIVYTIDGTDPNENSFRYRGPISISRTVVLRARAVGPGLISGPVTTAAYLLNPDSQLPVVSLVVDPEAMFDPVTGLYMHGPGASGSFPYQGANFWEDRELAVHVQLLEPSGTVALDHGAGYKIYGGWSRGHPQRSFSLFARGIYGKGEFDHRFFPDRPYSQFEAVTLRNSGNDWGRSMLRDGFMQTLVTGTQIDRQAFRPAVVMINGEYWGIHNLREKLNEHYLAANFDVDPDAVDLLEFNDGAQGARAIEGTTEAWERVLERLGRADIASPQALSDIREMVDLDNFIDYHLAQIYFDNRDWPGNNAKAWRPRTEDGRFRWILYDTDFGYGIWNADAWGDNTLQFALAVNGPNWPNPPWSTYVLRRMVQNPGFVQAFATRLADLLNAGLQSDRASELLAAMAAAIAPEMPAHADRWGLSVSDWNDDISAMREFARRRPSIMLGHFQNEFQLSGLTRITVEPGPGGRIAVNRNMISEAWEGAYWNGLPLQVQAVPNRGYRFVRWTGSTNSEDRTLVLDPADGINLHAEFAPAEAPEAVVINEIQYNAGSDSGDWVELINAGPLGVNLAGWVFGDATASVTLPEVTLEPGAYVVLCQDAAAFQNTLSTPCLGDWPFGLSGAGEAITLRDGGGVLADSVAYSDRSPWPAEPDGSGHTLSLVDPESDNNAAVAWRPSRFPGGTPGLPNAVYTGVETPSPETALRVEIYPNPFRETATVALGLPRAGMVRLEAFDLLGRRVWATPERYLGAGIHRLSEAMPSGTAGVYAVRVLVDGSPMGWSTAIRLD